LLEKEISKLNSGFIKDLVNKGYYYAQIKENGGGAIGQLKYYLDVKRKRLLTKEQKKKLQQVIGVYIAKANKFHEHKIRKGENLALLGRAYGRTVKQIKAANPNVEWNNLKVGQIIKIPKK